MSLSLEKIVTVAAQVYPDNFLEQEFSRRSKVTGPHSADEALAAYISGEFVDLYDPDSSDEANLTRISAGLERSVHLIEKIAAELRRLSTEAT